MAISFQYEVSGDLLEVITRGKDESLQEATDYAREVLGLAIHHACKRVLCDERELVYHLSTIDTYQLAETASREARQLRKIAIVCAPEFVEEGKFYETVAHNRGLVVLVSTDYQQALDWLE